VVGDRLEEMRAGNVVCISQNVAPDILNNVEKLNGDRYLGKILGQKYLAEALYLKPNT
jgi:hypothetical protein